MRADEAQRIIIHLLGRLAIPVTHVEEIVTSSGKGISGSAKYVRAYNMCDGTRNQSEITAAAKVDKGNFSRAVSRWIQNGILFQTEEGKLLHVYPIPEKKKKQAK